MKKYTGLTPVDAWRLNSGDLALQRERQLGDRGVRTRRPDRLGLTTEQPTPDRILNVPKERIAEVTGASSSESLSMNYS